MLVLYRASGSAGFELAGRALSPDGWQRLMRNVCRLLEMRDQHRAAELLRSFPFEVMDATNDFRDDFSVLHATVPLEEYVNAEAYKDQESRTAFQQIATTITEVGPYIRFIAIALDTDAAPEPVASPTLQFTSEVIERALNDAERLLTTSGPSSAVDRVHTAIHGYVRAMCAQINIGSGGAGLTELFKHLREQHPAFQDLGPHSDQILRMLRALSTILDTMNTLRNRASVAHPNDDILANPEAMLAINAVRTVLHYLDSKVREKSKGTA
jgi:hypothetical protein